MCPVARTVRHTSSEGGQGTLSSEPCRKHFFLYPPTTWNMQLLEKNKHLEGSGRHKFNQVCEQLEGGVQILLDPSEVLHMPSCCLHAVLTASAGMMANLLFVSPKTFLALAKWVAISRRQGPDIVRSAIWTNAAIVAEDANFPQAWYAHCNRQSASFSANRHRSIAHGTLKHELDPNCVRGGSHRLRRRCVDVINAKTSLTPAERKEIISRLPGSELDMQSELTWWQVACFIIKEWTRRI